jgi:uncharacterized protein (TIGR03435 family)
MKWLVPLIAAGLALAGLKAAQERPAFEVASVKPDLTDAPGSTMRPRNGGIEFQNYSLRLLVQTAYRVHDYACSAPSWLDSLHFDIFAKMPAGANFDRLPEMLQTLLAERFKLAVHREVKEMPGLALVVDKKGARVRPVEPGPKGTSWGSNMVQGSSLSMAEFAGLLSNSLNLPAKDLTGLPGVYDIKIRWAPDLPASSDPSDLPGSVYAAVQELGLKLQAQKVPVEILVVDRAERVPAEN